MTDSLLTDLCTICHLNPPKYRCPRCSTRTCSLPCTRRHKLWSQCSGVRDPGAYLRRSELATESAFDRDFNFITGIERGIERAERDASNRGVNVSAGGNYSGPDLAVLGLGEDKEEGQEGDVREQPRGKRKREDADWGVAKGEAGFLRRAASAGVSVVRAPKGMSRNKLNASRWNQRNKYLNWTIEWITENGEKRLRNSPEIWALAEAFDRAFPVPKEERNSKDVDQPQPQPQSQRTDAEPTPAQPQESEPGEPSKQDEQETSLLPTTSSDGTEKKATPHRDLYFYLHRPRTSTKQPVLVPLSADMTLSAALRGGMVLEFPTIYVLQHPLADGDTENPKFILETDYLRTHDHSQQDADQITANDPDNQPVYAPADVEIRDIDEGKVLEVLKKDLLDTTSIAI